MTSIWQIAAALVPLVLGAGLPVEAAPASPPSADAAPATSNSSGAEYPRFLPSLRVALHTQAPDAQKVEFALGK